MKKTGLLIIIILMSNNLFGQNAFTLENAIDYALENNRLSKNANSDLEIANAKKMGNDSNRTSSDKCIY